MTSRIKLAILAMAILLSTITVTSAQTTFQPRKTKPLSPKQFRAKWQLAWGDEFEGKGLPDDRIWNYDVGGHGWGNNELEFYTDHRTQNVRLENGHLVIEAHAEAYQGRAYTSGRITTKRKADLTYGRWEVRAKFSGGRGSWPAIWLLPSHHPYGNHSWPDNGEIDIMEHVGWKPSIVHGSVHTKAYNHTIQTEKQHQTIVSDFDSAFHTYAVEIGPQLVKFFVDDLQYGQFDNDGKGQYETWPFDLPMHLVLNVAVGGGWGGAKGIDPNIFPISLVVDYVRCYAQVK
jgi:beta-glucanase (GH16 family)